MDKLILKTYMGVQTSKYSKYNPDYKRTRWVTFVPEIMMHYNAEVGKVSSGVMFV